MLQVLLRSICQKRQISFFYITPSLNLALSSLPLNELFACQNNFVPCWISHWCQNSKLKTFWIVRQTDKRTYDFTSFLKCATAFVDSAMFVISFSFILHLLLLLWLFYLHTHIRVGSKYEWHALLTDLIWKSCSWRRKKNSVKKRESESRKTSEPTSKYPHQQNIRNLLKERERTNWQLPANVDTKKKKKNLNAETRTNINRLSCFARSSKTVRFVAFSVVGVVCCLLPWCICSCIQQIIFLLLLIDIIDRPKDMNVFLLIFTQKELIRCGKKKNTIRNF